MMKYIATIVRSKKTKKRMRSRAANVPNDAVSRNRNSATQLRGRRGALRRHRLLASDDGDAPAEDAS